MTHDLITRYSRSCAQVFGQPHEAIIRGEGCRVWDAEGRQLLDLLGGIAVNSVGHAHPRWVASVADQAATLAHVSNFFTTGPQVQLAERLVEIADMPDGSAVFLANSGTEAVEAAIKLARRHGAEQGAAAGTPARTEIIAFEGGFHGRTMGALALTAKDAYRTPFEPLPAGVRHIPFADVAAARSQITERTSAVIVEPVQGEAGVRIPPPGWLAELRRITREVGALLIIDEVQTGIGRTGQWLASAGLEPDAVTLAKGLGGGFPIGALLTRGPQVSGLLGPGQHGTTFGGNPLACRAALETLAIIEDERLLDNARERGAQLASGLAAVDGVAEVRQAGLLIGVDLNGDCDGPGAVTAAREAGFIINAPGPRTLRLAPPLLLSEAEAAQFITALPSILAAASHSTD